MTSIRRVAKANSSRILSIGAGSGVILTAYLTGVASFRAAEIIMLEERKGGTHGDPRERLKERTLLVWKLYIPAGAAAATTIICIVGSKRVDAKKAMAAQTALAVSQRAYESYRAQVVQELGERKDKTFLAKVAEETVKAAPPGVIVPGAGSVTCLELLTGRYFQSSMEKLNRAVNKVNEKLIKHDYATLDDLYYELEQPLTSMSGQAGWESGRLLELEFSSVLFYDMPVLAFDYNYLTSF